MKSLPNSTALSDAAHDLKNLSAAVSRECVLVEITVFGICYLADEITGEVFNVPTQDFPAPGPALGQRLRFHLNPDDQIVNLELVP